MTLWIWLLGWHCLWYIYDWAVCTTENSKFKEDNHSSLSQTLMASLEMENFPYQNINLKLTASALLNVQLHYFWGISDPVIIETRGCFSGKCGTPLTSHCIAGSGMTLGEDRSWFAEALGIAPSVKVLPNGPPG